MPYSPEKTEQAQRRKRRQMVLWVLVAILVALLVAVGIYFYERYGQGEKGPSPVGMTSPMAASSSAGSGESEIGTVAHPKHPIPGAAETKNPTHMGSRNTSNTSFQQALMQALGNASAGKGEPATPLSSFLVSSGLIRRIVTTVDDLGRHTSIPARVRPVPPTPGTFKVEKKDSGVILGRDNAERYRPFVEALGGLDMKQVAAVYFRHYSAFQQAYQQLGFPDRYFNDRVIQVIDLMLAAPKVSRPVALVPYKGNYRFADPALEALPAGQKLMIRIGPQNAAIVRTELRELRAALVAGDADARASSPGAEQP